MKKKLLLVTLILLLFIVFPVLAEPNFTPIVETKGSDIWHYNLSYLLATSDATPFPFWLFFAILGLTLLFASCILSSDQGAEIFGLIAPFPLFVTMWWSRNVDIGGGSGVAALAEGSSYKWTLMENHLISSQVIIAVFFGILFIVSLLNIYRLYLKAKTVTEDLPQPDLRT